MISDDASIEDELQKRLQKQLDKLPTTAHEAKEAELRVDEVVLRKAQQREASKHPYTEVTSPLSSTAGLRL